MTTVQTAVGDQAEHNRVAEFLRAYDAFEAVVDRPATKAGDLQRWWWDAALDIYKSDGATGDEAVPAAFAQRHRWGPATSLRDVAAEMLMRMRLTLPSYGWTGR